MFRALFSVPPLVELELTNQITQKNRDSFPPNHICVLLVLCLKFLPGLDVFVGNVGKIVMLGGDSALVEEIPAEGMEK